MSVKSLGQLFGFVLVAALFSACGQVHTFPQDALAQPSEKVPALEVVRTWKELAAQPIVGTGANAARVGIEARRCDEQTGLLVYCLPKGEWAEGTSRPLNPLGPLAIRVVSLDHHEADIEDMLVKIEGLGGLWQVSFFAGGAKIGAAGRYRVEVTDVKGTVLAATTVEAVKTKGSPWLPMEVKEFAEDPKPSTYTLCQTAARPHWDGSIAMEPMERLPTFFPNAPDGTLDVSMKDDVVKVKSAKWLDDVLQDQWLIRWWVNGRAVLRRGGAPPFHRVMRDETGAIVEPMEFSFILQMDPTKLGARPGDRVEFQLLYCRDGIEFLQDFDSLEIFDEWEGARVRMSPRVVWQP